MYINVLIMSSSNGRGVREGKAHTLPSLKKDMLWDIIYKKIYCNNVIECIVLWLLLFKYKFVKSQLRLVFKVIRLTKMV